ncbi:MAG TPA: hypothetical protein DCR63_08540, partial [Microbacterium sp.]|nr:hypothetical protein [Microbacterium sp.]
SSVRGRSSESPPQTEHLVGSPGTRFATIMGVSKGISSRQSDVDVIFMGVLQSGIELTSQRATADAIAVQR